MKSISNEIKQSSPLSNNRKNRKVNLEISPDSEKFEKYLKEFNLYLNENKKNEKILIKIFFGFLEFSKKSKYQINILESNELMETLKDILINPKSNIEISTLSSEIIMNISKNENIQVKLIIETSFTFNCLFQIILININSEIVSNLLMSFLYITKNKEILIYIQENSIEFEEDFEEDNNFLNLNEATDKLDKLMSKIKIKTIARTLAERILDGLTSSNKKIVLEILQNLYSFDDNLINKESIEPLVRCLGDKNNDVIINALKILLFFTKNKAFHNDLLKDNFIFRLVRVYKQGIDEMDVVIVKILYDLFDNRNLYEILFKNNVLLMLSNYLMNFEVEKNEKYEEVIRNVFEIFKLIIKNTEEENNKLGHLSIQNPLVEDENLQRLIFKKAYSLAAISKNEESILSCLSLINIMLSKFTSTLLFSNDAVKSIIELVPPFFKSKKIEIIKYSLCIFEIILNKKSEYFQQEFISSNNQNFSIKSLVYSVVNLVNDFSGNYELLRMSLRILVNLSSVPQLQYYFLQEPQITVLKVFIDNLLKSQRLLRIEEKEYENSYEESNSNNLQINSKLNFTPNIIINKGANMPSPFRLGTKNKIGLGIAESIKGRKTSGSYHIFTGSNGGIISSEDKDKKYILDIKRKKAENISLLKDCFTVISNLGKNVDNLEVLRLKGFLDVITDKLGDNDTEILPYIIRCIQGFCQEQSCIDNILRNRIINKILNIYKLYRIEDDKIKKTKNDSNLELENLNLEADKNMQEEKKVSQWITTAKRLEVLKSLKIILESDIKLQRTFIIERGIEILLNDIINTSVNINESISDQLNEMILRVIYVVSCNINKLFLIYFNNGEKMKKKKNNEIKISSSNEDDFSEDKDSQIQNSFSSIDSKNKEEKKSNKDKIEKELMVGENIIKEENSIKEDDINNNNNKNNNNDNKRDNNEISKISNISMNNDNNNSNDNINDKKDNINEKEKLDDKSRLKNPNKNLFKIFSEQLSEEKFMNKLTEVGMYDKNNSNTYKELIKIFINLYLNRFYLEYFTYPKNFNKVIKIITKILKIYKENNANSYEIIKLIVIFLKFICEEERLIKKFLKEDVISILTSAIIVNDFYKNIKEEETKQFYYNFSLVLLRLTEFNGYIDKFETFQDFFKILEKLYEINSINGKIYIISIIRNIIAEKQDFFEELDLSRFLNKVVAHKNSLIVFEFVELIKNLVHSRSMCKRMESVFRYLINEIRLECYSSEFKKKMLDLILCLSYENSNIKDYSLQDLLAIIKNFDINMTQKTTLLLLMNFSSLSNNFEFLMQDYKENKKKGNNNNNNKDKKNINLTKKDFIQVVNQLINSDRFSQILIQRLLINITSIEGIDMSIISQKIIKVLIEILTKSTILQDNIIIFSLATLVNIINRNVLRFEELNKNNILKKETNNNTEKDIDFNNNGYLSGIESNEVLLSESNSENEKNKNKDIEEFKLSDNDDEDPNNNNKKEKNKKNILNHNKKNSLLNKNLIDSLKKSKKTAKSILKKYNNENNKNKKVEIKTINEENQKEEESSVKETEKEKEKNKKKEEEKKDDEDYKPLPESEKEVAIVDYIIEKVPNLIDIIKGLFNKGSIDINSLTIMFCCNLIRKIRYSKYKELESELIKCVDNYIQNEKLLNTNDNNQALLKTSNDKFLLIALIKYFICLSIEDIEQFTINNLNKSNIINIIMNNIKETTLNLKKLKVFKLTMNDIRENSINFALVENQLNLINYILLLIKQKNAKYFFGYRNQNEAKEYFEIFYEEFIKNFSVLLNNIIKDDEEQQKLNNMNKTEIIKEESDNENSNKNEESSSMEKAKKQTNEQNTTEEGTISKNQTIQNIIISLFKILIEYFVDYDYYNKNPEDKAHIPKKDLNVQFYNKISKYFESILNCVIKEKIEYLQEELKNLTAYILYFVLVNNIEKNEANMTIYSLNNNSSKNNTIRSGLKRAGNLKEKIETNLDNDINIFKWLIKLFIENKTNIHSDFFCIKLFSLLIYNDKYPNIFHEEKNFIKKLLYLFKYNGNDETQNILKIESERFLNILSFNYNSHRDLYIEGVYDIFKSNLYIKVTNNKKIKKKIKNNKKGNKNNKDTNIKEEICSKEDFILLVNMLLNNNNKEFIKDDLKNILSCVLPSKDLAVNIKYELFTIYLNIFVTNSTSNHFQEDFKTFFDLLFNNISSDFSETLFFYDKLINTYKNFSKKYLLTDDKLNVLFTKLLKFDKNFLSKKEEFITYIKMLEIRLNQNNISEDFEKIFKKVMIYATNEKSRDKLKDINILNSLLNFSLLFFLKYSEKKNFSIIMESDDAINEDNDIDLEDDKNKEENKDEDIDDYDESSSGDSLKNYGLKFKNKEAIKEIKTRIKKKLKKQLINFILNNKYSELIDIIINNSFHYDDLRGINILSMSLIQEDYKLILIPLKEVGNTLFKNEFFINLFNKFLNSKTIDVKEFSFFIHLFIVISNTDSKITFNDSISEPISIILHIYDKFLLKYLSNPKNYNNANNTGVNAEENKDNGVANGGNENQNLNEEKKNDNLNNNLSSTNLFNDTVTSLYFFCDLIKVNNLNNNDLGKILIFMIKIISEIRGFNQEQKEILIRYYQELLLNYEITSSEDLFEVHFPFLRRIHKDNNINFIEHLIFGTILINTKKDVMTNSIKEFLDMVTLICLHNELNFKDMDKKMLTNFYKFVKQICLVLSNKEDNEEKIKNDNDNMNNGKEEDDLETKIKIAYGTIENYANKINKRYYNLIKKDEDLNKKFKKLKQIIKDCSNF